MEEEGGRVLHPPAFPWRGVVIIGVVRRQVDLRDGFRTAVNVDAFCPVDARPGWQGKPSVCRRMRVRFLSGTRSGRTPLVFWRTGKERKADERSRRRRAVGRHRHVKDLWYDRRRCCHSPLPRWLQTHCKPREARETGDSAGDVRRLRCLPFRVPCAPFVDGDVVPLDDGWDLTERKVSRV